MARIEPSRPQATAQVLQKNQALVKATVGKAIQSAKTEVKQAVELMFDVKVARVQVVNEPGKTRRFGKTIGRTQDWKKAYVRLAPGQAIDYEAQAQVKR
jgi:large subunit ribosomal protein L23